ncbi:tetratricopeptide repeat protein [Mesobacterium pallidum]|uniref:tetratricopeptide repeat protein n=1 Tax=Mesobacterium pallidum TaxID=2872037 RepID=UPI001EE379CD|nr:tetratricopeptide repeat protein [Mesobacterium pallidum]
MRARRALAFASLIFLAACGNAGGPGRSDGSPYAPDIDPRGEAVDGLVVGHRLMAAGEHELALEAFQRAAAVHGLTPEVLSSMGTADLALGRLNQAENLFREALKQEQTWPELWNNLGVVLMERGKTAEAAQIFQKAYALDNGESDAIRDNLRLALEKSGNPDYDDQSDNEYKLVRRGSGEYLISRTP